MSRKSNLKRFNRLSRRTFLAVALIAALIGAVGGQRAAASDDPAVAFVQGVGNDVIAILGDKANSTLAEREAAFRDMMGRGFDIPTVTRFVLGRHWKSATNEQRAEFSAIFLDFIARVYASRFDSYSYGGEQFTVRSVIADESGDTIVQAKVARPSGADPVELDFRVRSKDGNHRVVDLYVEGISMLLTHRAEFSSVINRRRYQHAAHSPGRVQLGHQSQRHRRPVERDPCARRGAAGGPGGIAQGGGQRGETARLRLQSATVPGRKKLFQLAELLTVQDPLIDASIG